MARADNILKSEGYKKRLENYKWKKIISSYNTKQEVIDLYNTKTLKELFKKEKPSQK